MRNRWWVVMILEPPLKSRQAIQCGVLFRLLDLLAGGREFGEPVLPKGQNLIGGVFIQDSYTLPWPGLDAYLLPPKFDRCIKSIKLSHLIHFLPFRSWISCLTSLSLTELL